MKISVDFDKFLSVFNTVKIALNQKSIKEENRKITLVVNEDGDLVVSTFTALATIRGTIDCDVKDKGEPLILKSVEVGNILGAFQGMSKTHATDLEINVVGNGRVVLTIHEEPNNPEEAELSNLSNFTLMCQTVPKLQLEAVMQPMPADGLIRLDKSELTFTLGTLMKLMSPELNSKNNLMHFDSKYVFVASEGLSVVRNNLEQVGDDSKVLEGISFNHNQVSLLNAMLGVLGEEDTLVVAKSERTVFVDNGQYQAFFQSNRMDGRVVKMNVIGSPFDRSESGEGKEFSGMVVNRPYFQDILRRAELSGANVSLEVVDGILKVKGTGNNDFEQDVHLLHERGVEGIGFTLPISVLRGSILNNPLIATEQLFAYLGDTAKVNQKKLFFMDDTDSWMSVMVVPIYNKG